MMATAGMQRTAQLGLLKQNERGSHQIVHTVESVDETYLGTQAPWDVCSEPTAT